MSSDETAGRPEGDPGGLMTGYEFARSLLAAWATLLLSVPVWVICFDPGAFHNRWVPPPQWTPDLIANTAFLCFHVGCLLSPVESLHNRGWTRWAIVSVVVSLGWCVALLLMGREARTVHPFWLIVAVLGPLFAALATARKASSLRERGVLRPRSLRRRAVLPVLVVVCAVLLGYLNR